MNGLATLTHGNAYVEYEDAMLYARVTRRLIDGQIVRTLDLVNIARESRRTNTTREASPQSTGFMRRFMLDFEAHAKTLGREYVYIESVLNEFLGDWFEHRGYTLVAASNPACYYKHV